MKCFVYILKNKAGRYYTGITKLLPETRLKRHNKGDVFATKFGRPWEIIYTEEYSNYKNARVREKQIKSWHGGNAFKNLLSISRGSSNGRTVDSGSTYLGSSPSPREMDKIGN